MVELRLDRGQVGKDVGVVELEIVEDRGARTVMHELGALVEERGVVLVGLEDEEGRGGRARRHAEIARNTADQEPGLESGALEDRREHRRSRRLAVRARHREYVLAGEHVLGEPLRSGDQRLPAIEDLFHQRVAARHDVPDDPEVGRERDLLRAEPVDDLDAERGELRAHRRVDPGVAAGDARAGRTGERSEPAHEGAADAENVKVHGGGL